MTSPSIDWDKLAQSIAKGDAVLVLGPDAIPFYRSAPAPKSDPDEPAEATFSQRTRNHIKRTIGDGVTYFYERDNLFLFRDTDAKSDAQKAVKDCANDRAWLPDAELLRQIAAMKFPLVLSLSPEAFLRDAFSKYGISHQFDYFSVNYKTTEVVITLPKPSQPLLYNLCGYAAEDDYDSVILDYHDLFKLLTALLGDMNVPDVMRGKLKKATRFVLLGFHLERWYAQLLLHYINNLDGPFDNKNHNFAMMTKVSTDAREFVIEQFQMKCIAPSREEASTSSTPHAPVTMPSGNYPTRSQGQLPKSDFWWKETTCPAHSICWEGTPSADPNSVSMLKAQYAVWLKDFTEKAADTRDLVLWKNQLRSRILTFSAQLT